MGGLHLQGLMTIGAHVNDERVIRAGFAHLRRLREQILETGAPGTMDCRELSMGMTQDMELAIAEGSTIVRVGTGSGHSSSRSCRVWFLGEPGVWA